MLNQPLVSVILPVYNAERFTRPAIESILNQTYQNLELIIVNDCSIDSSLEILNEYAQRDKRVNVESNALNLKLSKTLNRAIALSKGKYLARMDADDISLPTRIEKQVKALEENPDVVIIGCNMGIIDEYDKRIGYRKYYSTDQEIRKRMFYFSPFSHPAIMIRKEALDKVGDYNHDYNPAEDYELYFRLGTVGKFMNLSEELFVYRIVGNSMTHGGTLNMESKTIEIRKKYRNLTGYHMPFLAHIYTMVHQISLHLISPSLRARVFHFVREKILS
jgi:glycosyltransferase involved in cell wall biosynthesis